MSHAPESEEIDRFMVSIAADSVGGGHRNASYLGAIVPEQRRAYFYARPGGDGVRFSIEGLEAVLEETGLPHLADWGRESERRGLRYTTRLVPLPDALVPFASKEAEAEWRAWRQEVVDEQEVLASAAFDAAGREAPVSLSSVIGSTNLSVTPSAEPKKGMRVEKGAEKTTDRETESRDDEVNRTVDRDKELQDRIREQALRIAGRTKVERGSQAHGRGERSEGR